MNSPTSLTFPCIRINQPIGAFFVGSIPAKELCQITYADVRKIGEGEELDAYLGIQRKLNVNRVTEIKKYVASPDACFPTAVILAVPPECAEYDSKKKIMTLRAFESLDDSDQSIDFSRIAKIIDGQHRIEGLRGSDLEEFEVNVSIFVDMDIADQGQLFSTVNLAQTKVNRSLVYDLYDLARTRSPQKTCHEIAVALDNSEDSPFFERIKRLGVATEGRFAEKLTQATFVQSLMKYISRDPMGDRNLYFQGKTPELADAKTLDRYIFRNMFIGEKDLDIANVVWNFFDAVRERWDESWEFSGKGRMLNQTNGFKALMRFLSPCYMQVSKPGAVVSKSDFLTLLNNVDLKDSDFSTTNYKPGSSGESQLFQDLMRESNFK